MDSDTPHASANSDPASAFEALRGEVSLLRRAVEGLTAERQTAPDYQPTLAAMVERLAAIQRSPGMRLTPKDMKSEIAHVVEQAGAKDRDAIARTSVGLRDALGILDGLIERAFTADRQNRWLLAIGFAGLFGGILLSATLPGIVARALPANWHMPERIAARTLRLNLRQAGEQMIAVADYRLNKRRRTHHNLPAAQRRAAE
jgi:hypothetical protein